MLWYTTVRPQRSYMMFSFGCNIQGVSKVTHPILFPTNTFADRLNLKKFDTKLDMKNSKGMQLLIHPVLTM